MEDLAEQLYEALAFCPNSWLLITSNDFLLCDLLVIFVTPMVEKNPILITSTNAGSFGE